MADIRFQCRYRPLADTPGVRQRAEYVGLSNPVLRRAGAMCLYVAALLQSFLPDDGGCSRHGFGHGDVVTDARAGDRFLETVGVDEDIVDAAVNVGTELQRHGVITQHHELGRLTECKARVDTKRATGAAMVRRG